MTNSIQSISVIIPTFNRGKVLLETIESVLQQEYPDFEVLIIDQTTDHPPDIFRALQNLHETGCIHWIREAIANLPRARNIGLVHATGKIVVYLDDDVLLPKNFLEKHARHYTDTSVHAVTGMILHPGESYKDRPRLPIPRRTAARRVDLQTMRYRTPLRNPAHFVGANMSFRTDVLVSLGGFSHHFSESALGEDMELAGRLHREGCFSRYDPECWLLHRVTPEGGCRDQGLAAFHRSRSRQRNYYFAVWHGLDLIHAMEVTLRRWLSLIDKKRGSDSGTSKADPPRGGSRLHSLAGRVVGACEGFWMAWRNRHKGGDSLGLFLNKGLPVDPNLALSIVIPSYNRGEHLIGTIEALLALKRSDFEIVVVDQTRKHPKKVHKKLEELCANDRVVYRKEKEPNASRARNIGVLLSQSPIILFLDDDITPMDGLIEHHLSTYTDPKVSAVGGRIIWSLDDLERKVEATFSPLEAATKPELPVCYTSTPFENALHLITCNMSLRRDRILEVGGFNERFRGYGEDIELVARLRKAGGHTSYQPLAMVIHHSAPTGGTREARGGVFTFGYRRGRDQNLSILLAVGFYGWVGYFARRQARLARKAVRMVRGRDHREHHLPRASTGPVDQILAEKSAPGSRILKLISYKSPQMAGLFCGGVVALAIWFVIPDETGSLVAPKWSPPE